VGLSSLVEARTGLHLIVAIGGSDVMFVVLLVAAGSLLALLPAIASYRTPVATALRS